MPGVRLGNFEIEALIGHGGSAQVYRARRLGDFAQTVAIKVIAQAAPTYRDHFQRERKILASMEHPRIARLIDGGMTPQGLLYMVMEYVDGAHLIEYAQNQRLGLLARLALFRQVCEAVSYAHLHLIVHRDIKPANIRVTAQGEVKLLDFGVAKLLEAERRGDDYDTATVLTPEFAAPEQMFGAQVTVATDVYALGGVLYQLLVGAPPFDTRGMPLHVAIDTVLHSDVTLPSSAATKHEGPVAAKLLRGDLDAIVMRAMRRKPEDRYASARELSDDIQRYVEHQPVLARRGKTLYLLSRVLRRHRVGFAAAAVSLGAIVVGLVVALGQAERAREAAAQAKAQAARAERTKQLLLSLFGEQDAFNRAAANARQPAALVANGLIAADRDLVDEPLVRADFLHDVGVLQVGLGDYQHGCETLTRAARERAGVHGSDSLQHAESLYEQTSCLMRQGKTEDARGAAAEVHTLLARRGQPWHPLGVMLTLEFAIIDVSGPQAAQVLSQAREAFTRASADEQIPQDARWVRMASLYAGVLEQARQDADAIAAAQEAIRRAEVVQGPDGALLISPSRLLAVLYRRTSDFDRALASADRGVRLARLHFGGSHESVTDLERVRADTLQDLGRLNDAAEGMRRAVASLSSDSTEQLRMGLLKDLGQLELMRGRANEAEGALSEAYMLARKVTGDENGYTWFVAGQWGKALAAQGRLRQAESIQREAVSQMVRIIGAAAYRNALVLEPLAETLSLQGAHVEAIRCAREALALSERQYSPGHRITYSYRHTLAAALEASGTAEALHEAEQILDKAIADIPRSTDASNRVVLADMLYVRGRLHRRARQFDAASRDLEQALALMQNTGAAKSDVIATELARAHQRI